jgi:hypothetical protein
MDQFATVGRYWDAIGAELARAKLESAGVEAHLGDEATVSIDWQLTNAVGGIRVFVPAADAGAAREILCAKAPPDQTDAQGDGGALTPKELQAERAAKMALFGCMFGPLLLYSACLIVTVLAKPGELRPVVRRQLVFAIILTSSALAVFCALFVVLFS